MTSTACDTSVLIAAILPWHEGHDDSRHAMTSRVTAIPGHVVVECYSVLTRLPAPHRLAPNDAASLIHALPQERLTLPTARLADLLSLMARSGVRGGAAYDALVAKTAHHHGAHLLTRDRRARPTYDAVGVSYTLI